MRSALALAIGWGCLLWADTASTSAIGFSGAQISLAYTEISSGAPEDAEVTGFTTIVEQETAHESEGSASIRDLSVPADVLTSIGIGDEIRLDVASEVSAVGPLGLSSAYMYSAALLSATNLTTSALDLTFAFEFDLVSDIFVTDASREVAVAFSYVAADFYDDGSSIFEASTEADSDFGPLFDSLTDSVLPDFLVPFTLRLDPRESRSILLGAVVDVAAASAVPVRLPTSAPLLAAAFGLLASARMTKRRPRLT